MSAPGIIETEVEIFSEVQDSIVLYMRQERCSFDTTVGRALRVLGAVDAAKQCREKVYHFPGYANQMKTQAYQPIYGELVNLEKLGKQILSKPARITVQLPAKSYDSLRVHLSTYSVAQPIALLRAVFLLTICHLGDLWVKEGSRYRKFVIDN